MRNQLRFILASILMFATLAGCNFPTPTPGGAATLPVAATVAYTSIPNPTATAELVSTPGGPTPVIIDTDMATDDWQAILFLLNRTDVEVIGIAVTGSGEARCEAGVRNAASLVAIAGHVPIPVACGRSRPWQGSHVFPVEWRDAMDGMLGMEMPAGENPTGNMTAFDLYVELLGSSTQPISILTLGPYTNLGELFAQRSGLASRVKEIVSMAGAVHVAGNVTDQYPYSEWNVYIDPAAVNIALQTGVAVVLIPLDATNKVIVTPEFYNRLKNDQASPAARWVYDLYTANAWIYNSGMSAWDTLAAAALVERSLVELETTPICVVEEEGRESGRMETSAGCPFVLAAIDADAAKYQEVFLDGLNGR